jgi:hypothetical protein
MLLRAGIASSPVVVAISLQTAFKPLKSLGERPADAFSLRAPSKARPVVPAHTFAAPCSS